MCDLEIWIYCWGIFATIFGVFATMGWSDAKRSLRAERVARWKREKRRLPPSAAGLWVTASVTRRPTRQMLDNPDDEGAC